MSREKPRHPVAEWRDRQGLTQADLAARIGCKRWLINRIETGAREPSMDMLKRLVAATGLSADAILAFGAGAAE